MTRHSRKERTPEEIRAGNKRLARILLAIVAFFFVAIFVDQYLRSKGVVIID
jgi:hypothetical protein